MDLGRCAEPQPGVLPLNALARLHVRRPLNVLPRLDAAQWHRRLCLPLPLQHGVLPCRLLLLPQLDVPALLALLPQLDELVPIGVLPQMDVLVWLGILPQLITVPQLNELVPLGVLPQLDVLGWLGVLS